MFLWAKYICSLSLLFAFEEGTFHDMVTAAPVNMENCIALSVVNPELEVTSCRNALEIPCGTDT
jgi:hypothetical protein